VLSARRESTTDHPDKGERMAAVSIAHAHDPVRVAVGVDTHKNTHVGHAKDELGRDLGNLEVPTTARGYAALLAWARSHGEVVAFGVEGTSSYGIGLSRYLQGEGLWGSHIHRRAGYSE